MRRIVTSLSSDTELNDVLVHGFVCRSQYSFNRTSVLFCIKTFFL